MNYQKHQGLINLLVVTVFFVGIFLILAFNVVNNSRIEKGEKEYPAAVFLICFLTN